MQNNEMPSVESLPSEPSSGDSLPKESLPSEPSPLKFRIALLVIRAAGLVQWTIVFIALFILASVVIALVEPTVDTVPNAAWLMFQVVTTIGLGDFTCTSVLGRFMVIAVSIYSVFYLALVTSVLVSYSQERMRLRRDESVAHFIDQLEHLSDLNQQELNELSEKVRRFEANRRKRMSSLFERHH